MAARKKTPDRNALYGGRNQEEYRRALAKTHAISGGSEVALPMPEPNKATPSRIHAVCCPSRHHIDQPARRELRNQADRPAGGPAAGLRAHQSGGAEHGRSGRQQFASFHSMSP